MAAVRVPLLLAVAGLTVLAGCSSPDEGALRRDMSPPPPPPPAQAIGAHSPPILGQAGLTKAPPGQTLMDVARAYDLGYVELMAANPGVDPWLPPADRVLTLPTAHIPPPTPRRGVVVNLAEMRVYWYRPGTSVPISYPVGIGRVGWTMTPGTMTVVGKRRAPRWVVPASIRAERPELPAVVPPGPDNPMGAFSLDLSRGTWRIHGTNQPDSVGRRTSHGCLHLYPEDIERLFHMVPVGTVVTVVDEPVLLAWKDGELYLDVHPTIAQAVEIEEGKPVTAKPLRNLAAQVRRAAGPEAGRIDWPAVHWIAATHDGVPHRITRPRGMVTAEEGS